MQVTEKNFAEIEAQLKEQYGTIYNFSAELNGEKVYGFLRKPSRQELFAFLNNVSTNQLGSMGMLYDLIVIKEFTHPIFESDDAYNVGVIVKVPELVGVQSVELKKS